MIESFHLKPIIGFLNSSLVVFDDGKTCFRAKQNSENLYYKIDEFLTLSNQKRL